LSPSFGMLISIGLVVLFIAAFGVLYNSVRALARKEGVYDEESRLSNTLSGWAGIILSLLYIIWFARGCLRF
jgi:ABC-type nickel/cobalt efflux system permease component RcnA